MAAAAFFYGAMRATRAHPSVFVAEAMFLGNWTVLLVVLARQDSLLTALILSVPLVAVLSVRCTQQPLKNAVVVAHVLAIVPATAVYLSRFSR